MSIIVIYHGNCADGFTAAWAARKFFGDTDVEYYAATHQQPPPDCTGKKVVIVDFCYPREVLRDIARGAYSVLVLDHHKSAAEDLYDDPRTGDGPAVIRMDKPEWKADTSWPYFEFCNLLDRNEGAPFANIYALFDMERSGAGITWDFFHAGSPRPAIINHVEDRDLWRFKLEGTREIQANIFSFEYTFANWDKLAAEDPAELALGGVAIERKHHKDVAELVKLCQRPMMIGGHTVPVASLPYTLVSDAGHIMAQGNAFAACYWDVADGRIFGLRSAEGAFDVSLIAKQYGGGGHKNAAGFKVPRDHELARA